MNQSSAKHYPTYLALMVGMVTSFFLGMLLVEMPFAAGLDYFHKVQRDNLISRQILAYQKRNAMQKAEIEDSQAMRNVAACQEKYESCTGEYMNALSVGTITEAAWLTGQVECARAQSACVVNASKQ